MANVSLTKDELRAVTTVIASSIRANVDRKGQSDAQTFLNTYLGTAHSKFLKAL